MAGKCKKDEGSPKNDKEEVAVTSTRSLTPFEEMDRFFEHFFPRALMHRFGWDSPLLRELPTPFESHVPRVDVIERDDELVVKAEIPGMDKKDIEVSLTENTVTIRGSTGKETKEERENYYRREISRGSFSRTVSLPTEVDVGSGKAKFKDGVLEITIDKEKKSKRHSIKVE